MINYGFREMTYDADAINQMAIDKLRSTQGRMRSWRMS